MNSSPSHFFGPPTLKHVVSQSCTASQFSDPHYNRLAEEITQAPVLHRKQWEYIYTLRALEQLDLLEVGKTGLGFGCGKEPLAVVMAKHGVRVTVTDIPPFEPDNTNWGSSGLMDLFYGGICTEEVYRQMVDFRAVDMNAIPDNLGLHDFVWSCCALEHLGSLKAGMDFILNSTKCLKPGGYGIHTTEFNTSSDTDTLESTGLSLYRRRDFLDLQDALVNNGCSLMPLNLYTGNLPADKFIDLPPYSDAGHLKLLVDSYAITSVGLILRKNDDA